jgi:endonuclease-3
VKPTPQMPGQSALRRKVARVVQLLEEHLGIPRHGSRRDPLDSLIGTILSQSTNDRNRDRAYASLRQAFPTWEAVLNAPAADIARAIRVGGLSNQKSTRIKSFLVWVKQTFGKLSLDALRTMPTSQAYQLLCTQKGIGLKTVAVTLLFACRRDVFPVDTHVHRICRRLGLVPADATPEKTHRLMAPLVPKGKALSLHVNLLRHGRTTCRAQRPSCGGCCLRRLCEYSRHHQEKPV